jgi:L-fuconolactonase
MKTLINRRKFVVGGIAGTLTAALGCEGEADDSGGAGGTAGSGKAGSGSGGGGMNGASGTGGVSGASGASGSSGSSGSEAGGAGGSAGDQGMMMSSGIIDTHTHFWDVSRPVPAERGGEMRFANPARTIMPADVQAAATPHGIVGTVVVEASSWIEDNDWLLEVTKDNPFVVGMVGNFLEVFGTSDFAATLTRFAAEPLFRGVRAAMFQFGDAELRANFEAMAAADLMVDVNPNTDQLIDVADAASRLPGLRIVIDHLANQPITGGTPSATWLSGMRKCAEQANVFLKVSRLIEGGRPTAGSAGATDPAHYKPILDAAWEIWGEDRLIFGSNWPVLEGAGSFADAMNIIKTFMSSKTQVQQNKFFNGNSKRVYKWLAR